jgi:hypothetical protein
LLTNLEIPRELYLRAESELLLHINKDLYRNGIITEEMYNKAMQMIIDGKDLTNS